MPSVVHVVVTEKFAGVERYVASTARELARRGWEVSVVGGKQSAMSGVAGADVRVLRGATVLDAIRSLKSLGRQDICHVHMTLAELVAVLARPVHHAPIVSTRHFAARRGSRPLVRAIAPIIGRCLARQIAVSEYVSGSLERRPDAVVVIGVPPAAPRWRASNRVALVLQRLEPEKDTLTAIRAWQRSALVEQGWSMRIVGDGSQREALTAWVESNRVEGITFGGWTDNVDREFAAAGMLLAPSAGDSVGLTVLEAMAAGVPVVACASGGHLETVGRIAEAPMFSPGNFAEAAGAMRSLTNERVRDRASDDGRRLVAEAFSLRAHVDQLVDEYALTRASRQSSRAGTQLVT